MDDEMIAYVPVAALGRLGLDPGFTADPDGEIKRVIEETRDWAPYGALVKQPYWAAQVPYTVIHRKGWVYALKRTTAAGSTLAAGVKGSVTPEDAERSRAHFERFGQAIDVADTACLRCVETDLSCSATAEPIYHGVVLPKEPAIDGVSSIGLVYSLSVSRVMFEEADNLEGIWFYCDELGRRDMLTDRYTRAIAPTLPELLYGS